MRKLLRVAVGLTIALGACSPDDQITVVNENSPDKTRALARPADVENLISGSFASWYSAVYGGNDNINNQMSSMAMENGSALANFAMGPRSAIPRSPITNVRSNSVSTGNLREFNNFSRAAAAAALGISRIGPAAGQLTIGSTAADNRAKAFGFFVMGAAHGMIAVSYDSGAFITPSTVGGSNAPSLVAADSMFKVAMAHLDSSIAYASDPASASAFPLPATWMPGNSLTVANFVRYVRSYKAKIRASMARTPAERALVDWTSVLADATNGITTDITITTNTTTLFNPQWPAQQHVLTTWHQMALTILGMADTSGAYVTWITSSPMGGRGSNSNQPFVVVTPDQRFPQGTTLAAQVQNSSPTAAAPFISCNFPTIPTGSALPICSANNQVPLAVTGIVGGRPYFRARPSGENAWDGSWYNSPYDFFRYRVWYNPASAGGLNRTGPYPLMLKVEVSMLAAEANYRLGNFAAASALVDASRTANGLPAIAGLGLTTVGTVQGAGSAAACIPKIPTGAQGPVVCGGLLEAIKYEKRMETVYTSFGAWYLDMRGWGDLPQGTSLQWATPWQELDTRFKTLYDRPTAEVAPLSAYGW